MWRRYKDLGVQVWGIASRENQSTVSNFTKQLGITFPILLDDSGAINDKYQQESAFPSAAYPQDWVIDTEGKIIYINNGYELDSMIDSIELALENP